MPRKGKPNEIWVYTSEGATLQRISKTAAEDHFYGKTKEGDGAPSLDDKITRYESERLGALINRLRNADVSQIVDPNDAAEVISHLAPRSSHFRDVLTMGMDTVIDTASEIFSNVDLATSLIGLSGAKLSEFFSEQLRPELSQVVAATGTSIPISVMERMAFVHSRENFPHAFANFQQSLPSVFSDLGVVSAGNIRQKHNEMLDGSLFLDKRRVALAEMKWSLVEKDDFEFILPDCIAIGIDNNGVESSYAISAISDENIVVMPISSRRLLIGHRGDEIELNVEMLNETFSRCSEKFFLSNNYSEELIDLSKIVGKSTSSLFGNAMKGAVDELIRSRAPEHAEAVTESNFPIRVRSESADFEYQLTYEGDFSSQEIDRISSRVIELIGKISQSLPLMRLDGITFAFDYAGALDRVDRGIPTADAASTGRYSAGVGVAQAPLIVRNGVIKHRVVVDAEFGLALLSTEMREVAEGVQVIVSQLAEAVFTERFERRLPGFLLKPFETPIDAFLYARIGPAITSHFSARISAAFDGSDEAMDRQRQLLVSALREMNETIPAARLDYRYHGDMDRFLEASLPKIEQTLMYAGYVIGYADGLRLPALSFEARELLAEIGLKDWFDIFAKDLATLWSRQNMWESFDEFRVLCLHVERLCWQYGIVPFGTEEGGVWIEVPLGTDAATLMAKGH